METTAYTKNVGVKFNEDGSVRAFPGNTVICKIDSVDPVYSELMKAHDLLRRMPAAEKYVFMPPSSYHMTVIEGVCDQVRSYTRWTERLPLDASLEQVDYFFIEQYETIRKPEAFSMMCNTIRPTGIRLVPRTEEDWMKLSKFRDEVSVKWGLRFPGHDQYEFHITLAYNLVELTEAEKVARDAYMDEISAQVKSSFGVFETSAPELVFFEDMFLFSPMRKPGS
ncbi:DUF1868 domain-containing protein [Paenibacillus sp. LMG 31456]|uniref:DUF1868 domain-containing protein n=1 Tax=Paenibacillus foliorum TaxID=2654974 RepID=A0A972GZZ8_9BACL|nr:DUF1868 domain-containing protein [Paenibacillus foliorum]NOU96917.1 DUF1868 domain-containing protein [Paenibacillus foliorum]